MSGEQTTECFEGLERSCAPRLREHIVSAPSSPGLERMEASFGGRFFAPHRHDSYAIGITLQGVQTFYYRGASHFSTPGRILVLHPDETHDGAAGTDEGLRYRMLYLAPELLRAALGYDHAPLPFVRTPVIEDARLLAVLNSALGSLDADLAELQADEFLSAIAGGLMRNSDQRPFAKGRISYRCAHLARDYLRENMTNPVGSGDLESVTGIDRFAIARHFRAAFGTSPHRYLIMRRLECARRMIAEGLSLAETAATVGFADQSHFTRHFKRSFGITPGKWAAACRGRCVSG